MKFASISGQGIRIAVGTVAVGALAVAGGLQPILFSAQAQDATTFTVGETIAVNTDGLNLRDDATTASSILTVLPQATYGTILDGPTTADDTNWYLIDVDGLDGYVSGDYLIDSSASVFSIGDVLTVNTDTLNLRDDSTASGNIVTEMTAGTLATVLDGPVDSDGYAWYQLDVDGTTGWAVRDYLAYGANDVGTTAAAAVIDSALGDLLYVNTDVLNVRDSASSSAAIVATVAQGDTVTATGTYQTADGYTWTSVRTSAGESGFAVSDYLTADSSNLFATGDSALVNTDSLSLRATAGLSGEVLSTLESGTTVTILSASESVDGYLWYEVESEAGTGWVAGAYLAL